MSYVAEPYLYVTDQILTALTGGVGRESHRFFAGANSFSFEFASDQIINESVRVIGQVNQAFFSFQDGRDFVVNSEGQLSFKEDEKSKGRPDSKATWPDEGSEFFVSYYHSESGKALLTDRNIGSLTRMLAESIARELAVLRKQLELVYKSGFIDTAEGSALDMVVALLDLTRKSREYVSGRVRFFRETPAPADIFIPVGTRVSTDVNPPAGFVTTIAKTLRRGQLAVEIDVLAETKGPSGAVATKTITVINQPILGISGVTNDAPTIFGGTGESDAELRARAKKVAQRAGKATPAAMINALTEVEGLKENDIKVVEELQLRPGVVQVFIARKTDDPAAALLAKDVQEKILDSRAAGIRVEHNLEVALPHKPNDRLPTFEGRDDLEPVPLPPAQDFRLPVVCDVLVFPDNPRLTGAEKTTLTEAVRSAIVAYIANSSIGGTIVYNQLVADVMALPGVLDIMLDIRAKEDTSGTGKRNMQVPDGRRAVLDDEQKDITVHFIGEVNFDFQVRVTLKTGATLTGADKEIRQKLIDFFTGNPAEVSRTALTSRLTPSELYNLQDLTWAVEFDEAGLIIRESGGATATTSIDPGDRAILRDVKVVEGS
jgi:uncharacterized phage protein gp47/JayE